MTAANTLNNGAGKVAFQVGKLCAGDVPFAIAALAVGRVIQGEAAIEQKQVDCARRCCSCAALIN